MEKEEEGYYINIYVQKKQEKDTNDMSFKNITQEKVRSIPVLDLFYICYGSVLVLFYICNSFVLDLF